MSITDAMILAAGLGTRMRPLTLTMPKPLIPVGGKALIDWNLDWLEAAGMRHVVINSSYLAEQLEAHVARRSEPAITVSREGEPPLETGGGVAYALDKLQGGVFLTMNSDAILPDTATHPVTALQQHWHNAEQNFLLLLVPHARAIGWAGNGDFLRDAAGRIRCPRQGEAAEFIFTGIQLMHRRAFADAPTGAFSLSLLWQRSAGTEGWLPRVRSIVHDGDWLNVGDLPGLAAAEEYLRARAIAL